MQKIIVKQIRYIITGIAVILLLFSPAFTHAQEDVQKNIANALKNPPATTAEPEPAFSYACTLLGFAKPEQRRAIVTLALNDEEIKTSPEKRKTLITRLNDMGTISPLEAEEFLPDIFSDIEIQKMGELWEEKYDLIKRAKHLSEESYGAKNMANEMFTLTNIAKTFGYVAGSLTVLLNGICNWKAIKEDPSSFFRIPQVWFGVGEIAAASYADSDRKMGEILADKSTLDTWNRTKSLDGLLAVVSAKADVPIKRVIAPAMRVRDSFFMYFSFVLVNNYEI